MVYNFFKFLKSSSFFTFLPSPKHCVPLQVEEPEQVPVPSIASTDKAAEAEAQQVASGLRVFAVCTFFYKF